MHPVAPLLFAITAALPASAAALDPADAGYAAVDSLLAAEVSEGRSPSVQYIRFDRDRILHTFRRGQADLSRGREMDAATSINAFSLTKVFTAVAVLRAAERGLLHLDDPVKRHLPAAPVSEKMTLRHLLGHTSGLSNPIPIDWVHLPEEHAAFVGNAFFAPILAEAGAKAELPGKSFRYSNLGYVLLGQVLEAVSGKSYERLLEEDVLSRIGAPAGEIGFAAPPGGEAAVGYHPRYALSSLALGLFLDKSRYMGKPEGKWRPFREIRVNGPAYGGIVGTPMALARFGQALLEDGGGLLTPDSRAALFTEGRLPGGKPTGMALGWFRGDLDGRTYFAHAGGGGGFYCELRIYPGHGEGSLVAFNRSGFSDARFLDRVDRLLPPAPAVRPPVPAIHRSAVHVPAASF